MRNGEKVSSLMFGGSSDGGKQIHYHELVLFHLGHHYTSAFER
jgi:hypothetical protein